MATNTRLVHAPPDAVWEVLADGWLYPLWVVGASRMRDVDGHWPGVGARLHHSVGSWPMLVDDTTEVVAVEPGLGLSVRAWAMPTGVASVRITLDPRGAETLVVIEESVVRGSARLVPKRLRDALLTWRNVESLRRLAYLAERRSARV